jgi:hypothetical protein
VCVSGTLPAAVWQNLPVSAVRVPGTRNRGLAFTPNVDVVAPLSLYTMMPVLGVHTMAEMPSISCESEHARLEGGPRGG